MMLVDVFESRLDVSRGQPKQGRSAVAMPPLSGIIKDVIHGNACPSNFWATATIDDLCTHKTPVRPENSKLFADLTFLCFLLMRVAGNLRIVQAWHDTDGSWNPR